MNQQTNQLLRLLALPLALWVIGCGGEEASPTCDACVTPPATTCVEDSLTRYVFLGECVEGVCEYQSTAEACEFGCADGACIDPCGGVECETPPSATCDGDELTMYAALGSCTGGACEYDVTVVVCSEDGLLCVDEGNGGACVEAQATCDDGAVNADETDVDCGGVDCESCADQSACVEDTDCLSGICSQRVCVAPSCEDSTVNSTETDLDCGGNCAPCRDGRACLVADDCSSGTCIDEVCAAPTCLDGVLNGAEIDVDCGGSICPECQVGESCQDGVDCVTGFCGRDGLCAEATCGDGFRNQGESDVDCGGVFCDRCEGGAFCDEGQDCASTLCADGICVGATCDDGIINADESDVDCGGDCIGCPGGGFCLEDRDCDSRSCAEGTCEDATCEDGIRNGLESAPDCGGSECETCGTDLTCRDDLDCASRVCGRGGRCRAPRCDDGLQNGDETDEDCGGTCGACSVDGSCAIDSDCASDFCQAGVCIALPSCDNGILDGPETGVDCGGFVCRGCAPGFECIADIDCITGNCSDGVCGEFAACDDGAQNGDELGLDCGGPDCSGCVVGTECLAERDCLSGSCFEGFCIDPACDDGVTNGAETDTDCGGGGCAPCAVGRSCVSEFDCIESACSRGLCSAPNCDDGVQNGGEAGIDCGGACGRECPIECDAGVVTTDLSDASTAEGSWLELNGMLPDSEESSLAAPPDCGPEAIGPERVFRFTPEASGRYRFTTMPTDSLTEFDTVLYVLDGGCTWGSPMLGCNDDVSPGNTGSTVEVELQAGRTAFIVADSKSLDDAGSSLSLGGELVEARCANGELDGDELGVDCGGPECGECTFPATCSDDTFNGDEISKDCGPVCGDEELSCLDECEFPVVPVDLETLWGGAGSGILDGGFGDDESRFEPGDSECFSGSTAGEVVYRFVAPTAANYTIGVSAFGADAMLYILDRRCADDATRVSCADESDPIDPGKSETRVFLIGGQTIFIVVDSAEVPTGPHGFSLTINSDA